jgi:hypothetical protein
MIYNLLDPRRRGLNTRDDWMNADTSPRNVGVTTEERCYLCGRSVRELNAMSNSLRSPILDWTIEEIKARIEILTLLQEKIDELLLMLKKKARPSY